MVWSWLCYDPCTYWSVVKFRFRNSRWYLIVNELQLGRCVAYPISVWYTVYDEYVHLVAAVAWTVDIISSMEHTEANISDIPLWWRHNELDGVSNHQPPDCLLNRLFGHRPKKTSKLRVTGLCARNSPGTGEFPAQMASNAENVSIWWRHHAY